MKLKTALLIGLFMSAAVISGCTDAKLSANAKAEQPLPSHLQQRLKAKDMDKNSPIVVRVFKEENVLEVWKKKRNGKYDIVSTYDICKWSGKLGPKYIEGDRQAPEGFYIVRPEQMNPNSNYYLSFNMGYPNAYDRANGRTGRHLMVHGACSSSGCYSMTDASIAQIYAFGRDSFRGGQREFQIQAFPFRMTAANMARYRKDPNYPFWKMLKEGYDVFEITKVPPKIDVCEGRYVFNRVPEGMSLSPTNTCPPAAYTTALSSQYDAYQKKYNSAFQAAIEAGAKKTSPSIAGLLEAKLVADWSKRRAAGEKVSSTPPSLTPASAEKSGAPDISPVDQRN